MDSATPAKLKKKSGFTSRDIFAGFSVALIAIPQALAYAELAGMPAYRGLYALAVPAIAAAFFASSPYLQTGPVATTSLLTFGVLSHLAEPGSPNYIALAGLLALVIGLVRVVLGVLRMGRLAYLLSQPVLMGFISAAAILIFLAQLPAVFGVKVTRSNILVQVLQVLLQPDSWHWTALGLALLSLVIILLGQRLSRLFPGVLVAVLLGIALSLLFDYQGEVMGVIPPSLPRLNFKLPWLDLPQVLIGGVVIALVGFAEAASISRTYATLDRTRWDANKEFLGQGVANIAAGLFGGFPLGGSFSRSAVNRMAGAKSRWSGAITGLFVLAFIPFTHFLSALPKAVLGAVVIASVLSLFRFRELWRLFSYSRLQAYIAWLTFALTLALAPRIDLAVLLGIAMAIAHHLRREQKVLVDAWETGRVLHVRPEGVLWFGSVASVEEALNEALAQHPEAEKLELHLDGLGRIDLSAALMLERFMEDVRATGLDLELVKVPPMAQRWLERIWTTPQQKKKG